MAGNKSEVISGAPNEIIVTRTFDAPRELLWKCWTQPEHVTNWWGPVGFVTRTELMEFKEGGQWKHTMVGPDGTEYPNKTIFKEIKKPEKIVYANSGGTKGLKGVSFVTTWTFEAVGKQTKVTGRTVFDTAEDREHVAKNYGAIEGGKQHLENLDNYVLSLGSDGDGFKISRTFDATQDQMWAAWTDKDKLMSWFGPKGSTTAYAKMDFRPGGSCHYCLDYGEVKIWGKSIYVEINPKHSLSWINQFSDEQGGLGRHPLAPEWPPRMMTWARFDEHQGKTTVTIRWRCLKPTTTEAKMFAENFASMNQGWTGSFDQLEEFLKGKR